MRPHFPSRSRQSVSTTALGRRVRLIKGNFTQRGSPVRLRLPRSGPRLTPLLNRARPLPMRDAAPAELLHTAGFVDLQLSANCPQQVENGRNRSPVADAAETLAAQQLRGVEARGAASIGGLKTRLFHWAPAISLIVFDTLVFEFSPQIVRKHWLYTAGWAELDGLRRPR